MLLQFDYKVEWALTILEKKYKINLQDTLNLFFTYNYWYKKNNKPTIIVVYYNAKHRAVMLSTFLYEEEEERIIGISRYREDTIVSREKSYDKAIYLHDKYRIYHKIMNDIII